MATSFIRAGGYLINTDNVTHVKAIEGGVMVYFIGGSVDRLSLDDNEAKGLLRALNPPTPHISSV
jgi:hypothetical protein